MKRCCKKLNEFFDVDGPDFIEIDDTDIVDCNVEFNGLYAHGFRGKKHTEDSKKLISQAVSGENNPRYGVILTPEEKKNCSPKSGNVGASNPRALTFILTSPEGVEHHVRGALKVFCKEQGISFSTMRASVLYNRKGPRRNGWKIKKG